MCYAICRLIYHSFCFILKVILFLIIVEYVTLRFTRFTELTLNEAYKEGKLPFAITNFGLGGSILNGFTVSVDQLIARSVPWGKHDVYHLDIDHPSVKLSLVNIGYTITLPYVRMVPEPPSNNDTASHLSSSRSSIDNPLTVYQDIVIFFEEAVTDCVYTANKLQVDISYWNRQYYYYVDSIPPSPSSNDDYESVLTISTVTCTAPDNTKIEVRNYDLRHTFNYTKEEDLTFTEEDRENTLYYRTVRTDTSTENYQVRFIRPGHVYLDMDYDSNTLTVTEQTWPSSYGIAYHKLITEVTNIGMILRGKNAAGTNLVAGTIAYTLRTRNPVYDVRLTNKEATNESYSMVISAIDIRNIKPSNVLNIYSNVEEILTIHLDNEGYLTGQIKVQGYDEPFILYQTKDRRAFSSSSSFVPPISQVSVDSYHPSKFSTWFNSNESNGNGGSTTPGLLSGLKIRLTNYRNEHHQLCTVTGDFTPYLRQLFIGIVGEEFPVEAMITFETIVDESIATPSLPPVVTIDPSTGTETLDRSDTVVETKEESESPVIDSPVPSIQENIPVNEETSSSSSTVPTDSTTVTADTFTEEIIIDTAGEPRMDLPSEAPQQQQEEEKTESIDTLPPPTETTVNP